MKFFNKIIFTFVAILILSLTNIYAEDWSIIHHDTNHTSVSSDTLNLTNFGLLWKYNSGGYVRTSPSLSQGFVYAASYALVEIHKLNATDGSLVWNYSVGGGVHSSISISGDIAYFGSYDDNVYALNATTGAYIWNYTTGADIIKSSPAIVNGVVYIGSDDGRMYALNSTNGSQIWNYTTGSSFQSSPAIVNGVVYIGSDDGRMYALNSTNGSQIWNYTTNGSIDGPPMFHLGRLFFGSDDNHIYALNATTSTPLWNYTTSNRVRSSPVFFDNTLIFGSTDGSVYSVNSTNGSQIWNYSIEADVEDSLVLVGGILFFGGYTNRTYALNATNGSLIWRYTTNGNVRDSLSFSNGILYVGSDDGYIYAFTSGQCVDFDADNFNTTSSASCGTVTDCDDTNANILPPYVGMNISASTTLCNGTYYLNDTGLTGVIKFSQNNTILTCNNTVIIGNSSSSGIRANGNNNITIKNCNIQNYANSIRITKTQNSTFQNNTLKNSQYGLLTDVGALSSYNVITQNNASFNKYGIVLEDGTFNNITHNIANNNTGDSALSTGLSIVSYNFNSTNNIIFNNTANNNLVYGVAISDYNSVGSRNNTIYSNNITNNLGIGLFIDNPNATANLIYDNYFNNSVNVYDNGTSNYWNTSKTAGTNILNGIYFGGNYYSSYTGKDNSGDGIGEAIFSVSGTAGSNDSLPLTYYVNSTLNSPSANYANDSASSISINFTCSATSNYNLKNISLYLTNSANSSFSLNQTNNVSGISNTTNWTFSLSTGNYIWNCLGSDTLGNSDWGDLNRSLILNYTAPSSVCGNSVIETGETCDDGNANSGDGCSSSCQTETTGTSCFPAGTKILMSDGTEKNIEEIKVGDEVLSFDEILKEKKSEKVLEIESPIREHMCKIDFADGSSLNLTREHPIYTLNGWKSINPFETLNENPNLFIDKLNIGDLVFFADGEYKILMSIKCWNETIQTYNLKKVENSHTFYAENVLVHNKGGPPPECIPSCSGKSCGGDGCGGSCGSCGNDETCSSGACISVIQTCNENTCGSWSSCSREKQTRFCLDSVCPTEKTCTEECIEDWSCEWSSCSEGDSFSYPFGCYDLNSCGTEKNKPSGSKSCGEQKCVGENCAVNENEEENVQTETKNAICSVWSECKPDYSSDFLVGNLNFGGIETRTCNSNDLDKLEFRPCQLFIPVKLEQREWCYDNSLEVSDEETDSLVARIKISDSADFASIEKLNVLFTFGEVPKYCDYCYDGIKDYDEEGLDCGGEHCPSCVSPGRFFDWLFFFRILIWILFLFMVFGSAKFVFSRGHGPIASFVRKVVEENKNEKNIEESLGTFFRRAHEVKPIESDWHYQPWVHKPVLKLKKYFKPLPSAEKSPIKSLKSKFIKEERAFGKSVADSKIGETLKELKKKEL